METETPGEISMSVFVQKPTFKFGAPRKLPSKKPKKGQEAISKPTTTNIKAIAQTLTKLSIWTNATLAIAGSNQ